MCFHTAQRDTLSLDQSSQNQNRHHTPSWHHLSLLTSHDSVGERQHGDVGREGAEDEGANRDHSADHADRPTAILVGQGAGDRT